MPPVGRRGYFFFMSRVSNRHRIHMRRSAYCEGA
jgi:hypothetical protein